MNVLIYFNNIPDEYVDMMKYLAIMELNINNQPSSVNGKIRNMKKFLVFLHEMGIDIRNVNGTVERAFYNHLEETNLLERTKCSVWSVIKQLLKFARTWLNTPIHTGLFKKNPFSSDSKNNEKYIPDKVIKQLDVLFKDKELTQYTHTFYWIAKSIPSRASEVLGMKLDCLKPYGDDTWVVLLPTWKQNGGYKVEQIRRVYIHYTGHGKFLIDVIKSQREYAKSIQDKLPDNLKGYLFAHQQEALNCRELERSGKFIYYTKENYILPDRAKLRRD